MIISTECKWVPAEQTHIAENEFSQPITYYHCSAVEIKVTETSEQLPHMARNAPWTQISGTNHDMTTLLNSMPRQNSIPRSAHTQWNCNVQARLTENSSITLKQDNWQRSLHNAKTDGLQTVHKIIG
jgi:hypothetical protein